MKKASVIGLALVAIALMGCQPQGEIAPAPAEPVKSTAAPAAGGTGQAQPSTTTVPPEMQNESANPDSANSGLQQLPSGNSGGY
jgi:hypothetical protein